MTDIPAMKEKILAHQKNINNLINKALTTRETSGVYWSSLLKEIKAEYVEIKVIYRKYSGVIIEKDFEAKLKGVIEKVQGLKSLALSKIKYSEFINTDRITNTLNNAKLAAMTDFVTGIDQGIKKLTGTLRATQQKLITEREIDKALEEGFDTTKTWQGAKNKLLLEMLNKIKDGKIINITMKNGKERNYDAKDYAELVTRTRMRESETNATKQTALAYDTDLVQVSSHNTNCDICAEYEGKVYSIGGISNDFPPLDEEPPFHPNCKHLLIVTFRKVLEMRGIEGYQAFSNGEIDTPPYIPTYKPLSERELA